MWLYKIRLKSKNAAKRESAINKLSNSRNPQAANLVIEALKDEDYGVRRTAAIALGKIKDHRAVEPLVMALKDENSWVRQAAAAALGEIKDAQAIESLVTLLEDRDSGVRATAAKVLKALYWQPVNDSQRSLFDDAWAYNELLCVRREAVSVWNRYTSEGTYTSHTTDPHEEIKSNYSYSYSDKSHSRELAIAIAENLFSSLPKGIQKSAPVLAELEKLLRDVPKVGESSSKYTGRAYAGSSDSCTMYYEIEYFSRDYPDPKVLQDILTKVKQSQ